MSEHLSSLFRSGTQIIQFFLIIEQLPNASGNMFGFVIRNDMGKIIFRIQFGQFRQITDDCRNT